MNNRFKFRGIHPVLGELQEIKYIDFIHNTVDFGDGDIFKIEEVNMQQSTGLKDKNGKLIYEADIVRFKDCNDILVINYQKETACFAPQFYCNGKYGGRLWFDDYDSFECQFYKSNNFEVIGNIYENKDLLNENS